MVKKNDPTAFKFSCNKLLIVIQLLVFVGWAIQLIFHQTWLCIIWYLPYTTGLFISICISTLPLLCTISLLKKPSFQTCCIEYSDCLIIITLLCLGLLFWWIFSADAIHFPIHTYGDEEFHNKRVSLMLKDVYSWVSFIFQGGRHPDFHAEYMMYPALAYVPVTFLVSLLGNINSIPDQRISLVTYYLAVIFTTYLLARLFFKSKFTSALIAALPLFSALLISYTTSFYIELPYTSVLIFSFWLLAWGIRCNEKNIVTTAILASSLAPIIRESAFPSVFGIVLSASLWQYFSLNKKKTMIFRIISMGWYFIIGLLPFILYYIAKSNYTNYDRTRAKLTFILHQDYFYLFTYSFIYFGPLFLLALFYFMFVPRHINRHFYLALAAIISLIGSLFMASIFLPGYMPWSRNYMFYYSAFIVLVILFLRDVFQIGRKGRVTVSSFLLAGIIWNLLISIYTLPYDRFFHESEVVFDLAPTKKYMIQHRQQFMNKKIYMYCPYFFLDRAKLLLPDFVHLVRTSPYNMSTTYSTLDLFNKLPQDAKYVIFCYLKNKSRPKIFNKEISTVTRPKPGQLKDYHILVEFVDPWSQGRNGVLLLKKRIA